MKYIRFGQPCGLLQGYNTLRYFVSLRNGHMVKTCTVYCEYTLISVYLLEFVGEIFVQI